MFPGPQLPAQTARRPVTWASAAAAKAPASSCERDEGIQAVTEDPVHARDAGLTEDLTVPTGVPSLDRYRNDCRSAFAVTRSAVSNPSVKRR